jgi:nucleoside-diphosphate-sugar epimerase
MLDIVLEEFPEAKVEHTQRNALMPIRGTLSVKKAQQLLRYEPSYPIERGLVEYIEWYRGLTQSSSSLVNA